MFESFRNFVADFVEGDKHPSEFADNDYRLAAVALLVHAAGIDGDVSLRERDKLRAVVKRRFDLDDKLADELIDRATAAEHEAVDLYHFTKLLKPRARRGGPRQDHRDDVGNRLRGWRAGRIGRQSLVARGRPFGCFATGENRAAATDRQGK
jgi:hypothetical protein